MAQHRDRLRAQLAEVELKSNDIERLDVALSECHDVVLTRGIGGLVEHLENAAKQLEAMRRQPDRGAVDNFPIWKLGGLIVIFGVGIIALIHCGLFSCSIETRDAYIAGLIAAALITLGC